MKAWILVAALAAGGCASLVPNAPLLLSMKAEGVSRVYPGPEEPVWRAARATLHSYGGLVEENRVDRYLLSTAKDGGVHFAAWIDPAPDGWRVTLMSRPGTPISTEVPAEVLHRKVAERLTSP